MSFFTNIPTTASVLSAYTTVTASTMLVRTISNEVKSIVNQFLPQQLQTKLIALLGGLYGNASSSQLTLIIKQYDGHAMNQVYEASEIYLGTKSNNPSLDKLIVSKHPREKNITVMAEKDQVIDDVFQGIQVKWKLTCIETDATSYDRRMVNKFFELSFHKKCKETVLDSYLPYILRTSKAITEENRGLKLYSLGIASGDGNMWGSIDLDHPATFDTLAMDTNLKKEILDDLDRFVKRREFYKRVGKPWRRGYLLYGPPGTGKSSLVAAMANHLKFNIYDLELGNLQGNYQLRRLLLSTENKSILVTEDIDCSVDLQDKSMSRHRAHQLTLSGLLNFIDGLWSSCGDERIIVFTTNHKDRLDPALLRPGRMDMHIHMSYCTPCGFKILAYNYLQIKDHQLLREIETLLEDVNATPAEIAEELMKSDDAQTSLEGVISFLLRKKDKNCESKVEGMKNGDTESEGEDDENEYANTNYEESECW